MLKYYDKLTEYLMESDAEDLFFKMCFVLQAVRDIDRGNRWRYPSSYWQSKSYFKDASDWPTLYVQIYYG